jgi:hypothetical protein
VVGAFAVVVAHLAFDHAGKARSRRTGRRSARISPMASLVAWAT